MIDKSFNASSSTVVENPLKYHIRGCTSGIQYRLWDRTLLFPAALITASASGIWVGVWEGRGNWNWNWNWMLVVNVIVWLWLGLGWVHRLGPRVWLGWMFCEMAVIICLNIPNFCSRNAKEFFGKRRDLSNTRHNWPPNFQKYWFVNYMFIHSHWLAQKHHF